VNIEFNIFYFVLFLFVYFLFLKVIEFNTQSNKIREYSSSSIGAATLVGYCLLNYR